MEQLLYLVVVFIAIWVISVALVFFDIRHQKKHPPKTPNPKYTKHLET